MGAVSLYIKDDVLQSLDSYVQKAAQLDREEGLEGRAITNRSNLLEQLVSEFLANSANGASFEDSISNASNAVEKIDTFSAARESRESSCTNAIEEKFGSMVFDRRAMKEYLSEKTFDILMLTIANGETLDLQVANEVAAGMKEWALKHGATHYTHWFQPLSGTTSEKHDAFLEPTGFDDAVMQFNGKSLISGESDASSFPNGGLRATFEARGYTAWDPTSYAFIKDEVLCIPTAFCSYTGEALDKKTPLLRSMNALSVQTKRVLSLFGQKANKVAPSVGAEQEFFLIPKEEFAAREDLVLTGRTLFGYQPCKGQELEEHFYGAIRPTVNNFLKELDDELWSLGIAAKTKHNEVAPSQHELAPVYTTQNRAIDENLVTMEKMTLLSSHYGLACLLHEKPFEGINGSGKHNNWSLVADNVNLLDPGENPKDNIRFLVFLSAIIEAVDDYQELLRMSIASAGNDHRLGASEAPPSIVSIFLGDELTEVVQAIISDTEYASSKASSMSLGVGVLPTIPKDNTDRNRTSPFAFTGNKFEFRMPGSNVNLSDCNMILNTAVAKSLKRFADELEAVPVDKRKIALTDLVRSTLSKHERIIFNGNGYSAEWKEEAKRRGLANHPTTADALPCLIQQKSIELFAEMGVLNEAEIRSRYEVKLDKYNKLLNIEARVMKRMTRRAYVPAINTYAAEVAKGIVAYESAMGATRGSASAQQREDATFDFSSVELKTQRTLLKKLLLGLDEISEALGNLDDSWREAQSMEDEQARATFNAHTVIPHMERLRRAVDAMEIITSRDYWPVPSYNNMLFYV